jgi:hypothetical protein
MTTKLLQCALCRHLHDRRRGEPRTCDAFPDGIPHTILFGDTDHRLSYPGDHGIHFEPVPGSEIAKAFADRPLPARTG